ncbi:MAG: shikimate kinase [Acidobacteriota bacterium]
MDGYYDYHPRVFLDRPLALVGMVTDAVRAVAHQLAALNGLPYLDLDRKIEHYAGTTVWELIQNDGEQRYRAMERELLPLSLRDRPAGVLVLGDGTLLDPANRRLLGDASHLVYLELDLADTYWRFQPRDATIASRWHPLFPGPLLSLDQIRPFFDHRQPALSDSPHTVDFTRRNNRDVTAELQSLIEKLQP